MTTPTHWTPAERERFEERAAIMEFDGGLSREEAERLAAEAVEGCQSEADERRGEIRHDNRA